MTWNYDYTADRDIFVTAWCNHNGFTRVAIVSNLGSHSTIDTTIAESSHQVVEGVSSTTLVTESVSAMIGKGEKFNVRNMPNACYESHAYLRQVNPP
jgi:hypothetical protein